MKLSKTSEYALRILAFMAKDPSQLYSAKYLVETLAISDKYLRRLMTDLTHAGFIKSTQGRDGGYAFVKSPGHILLADVVEAVEGMSKYSGCVLGFDKCSDANPCVMHSTWVNVRTGFVNVFTSKSLADLDFNEINKY